MGEIDEKESLIFLIFNMSTLKCCSTEPMTVINNPLGPYQKSMIPSTSMQNFSQNGHNTMTETDFKENKPFFANPSSAILTTAPALISALLK